MAKNSLKVIVNSDIKKSYEILEMREREKIYEQIYYLIAKYEQVIPNIRKNLRYSSLFSDKYDRSNDLKRVIGCLEVYKANGYEVFEVKNTSGVDVRVENHNTVNLDIEISFDDIRNEINNNGYLNDESKREIAEKIDIIEGVSEIEDNPIEKWNRLKPVIQWISTSGVDIGIKLLSLVIKVIENH